MQEVAAVAALTGQIRRATGSSLGPIVTGDFNAEPDSDEMRLLGGLQTAPAVEGLGLLDVWRFANGEPGWTWRRDNPYLPEGTLDCRIDYIHAGLTTRVCGVGLIGAGPTQGVWPSTHVGVWADLAL